LPHGVDDNDHGAELDLSAEESHRRGRGSFPATIAITAEAQSDAFQHR
jgi:hypothetical protein